jgi:hypothetical protein
LQWGHDWKSIFAKSDVAESNTLVEYDNPMLPFMSIEKVINTVAANVLAEIQWPKSLVLPRCMTFASSAPAHLAGRREDLTEGGLNVVMLEAGGPINPAQDFKEPSGPPLRTWRGSGRQSQDNFGEFWLPTGLGTLKANLTPPRRDRNSAGSVRA